MTEHRDREPDYGSPLLKIEEAARYIGMSKSWLKQNSGLIAHVRIGSRAKRWRIEDLDAFIAASVRGSHKAGLGHRA
jgi:predicted DNA-binding transcriptional regulator AlpA